MYVHFQSVPRKSNLTNIKRMFIYVIDTTNIGLYYKKLNDYKLVRFCDVVYVGDKIERKNNNESC